MKHFYDNFFLVAIIYGIASAIFGKHIKTVHPTGLSPMHASFPDNAKIRIGLHRTFLFGPTMHPPENRQ